MKTVIKSYKYLRKTSKEMVFLACFIEKQD